VTAIGNVEEWVKWSLPFPDNQVPPPDTLGKAGWRAVAKTRYLKVFAIGSTTIRAIDPVKDAWPANGGQFEVTHLSVENWQGWTVGFEIFGDSDRLAENLKRIVTHVLTAIEPLEALQASNSYAYPTWLNQFLR
jgi:hypothetical protein